MLMWTLDAGVQNQGSPEWHEFRSNHIGASEVPAIMGTCDFRSAYQVWLDKTGIFKKDVDNFATQRGRYYEPIILEEYSKKIGVKTIPKVMEYKEWNILSASLDGWREDGVIVECKCPSKAKHQLALAGYVPETYKDQIQAQLLVSGASYADYVSFDPNEPEETRLAIVQVSHNPERQALILEKCKEFWSFVLSKTPPHGTAEQPELYNDLVELDSIRAEMTKLDKKRKELEDKIKSSMKANHVICENFAVTWTERKGVIDYSAIPELQGVDLERYRKPPTKVFTIKENKLK